MSTKKFLIGTLAGGIAFFLLGYLVYGLALTSFFKSHSVAPSGYMKTMSDFVWWALILGNLASAALLTYVFLKLGNITSFGSGARTGAAIGFFVRLAVDFIRFAVVNDSDISAVLTDVVVGTVMGAIAGGVIALVLKSGNKKS